MRKLGNGEKKIGVNSIGRGFPLLPRVAGCDIQDLFVLNICLGELRGRATVRSLRFLDPGRLCILVVVGVGGVFFFWLSLISSRLTSLYTCSHRRSLHGFHRALSWYYTNRAVYVTKFWFFIFVSRPGTSVSCYFFVGIILLGFGVFLFFFFFFCLFLFCLLFFLFMLYIPLCVFFSLVSRGLFWVRIIKN